PPGAIRQDDAIGEIRRVGDLVSAEPPVDDWELRKVLLQRLPARDRGRPDEQNRVRRGPAGLVSLFERGDILFPLPLVVGLGGGLRPGQQARRDNQDRAERQWKRRAETSRHVQASSGANVRLKPDTITN